MDPCLVISTVTCRDNLCKGIVLHSTRFRRGPIKKCPWFRRSLTDGGREATHVGETNYGHFGVLYVTGMRERTGMRELPSHKSNNFFFKSPIDFIHVLECTLNNVFTKFGGPRYCRKCFRTISFTLELGKCIFLTGHVILQVELLFLFEINGTFFSLLYNSVI